MASHDFILGENMILVMIIIIIPLDVDYSDYMASFSDPYFL